ncbi:MAG: hypothetical protein LBM38_02095 [Clostridiales bacterium]|jgi:hypothetical protein|nr:hypothetical protein [Clostridiales bacterium]
MEKIDFMEHYEPGNLIEERLAWLDKQRTLAFLDLTFASSKADAEAKYLDWNKYKQEYLTTAIEALADKGKKLYETVKQIADGYYDGDMPDDASVMFTTLKGIDVMYEPVADHVHYGKTFVTDTQGLGFYVNKDGYGTMYTDKIIAFRHDSKFAQPTTKEIYLGIKQVLDIALEDTKVMIFDEFKTNLGIEYVNSPEFDESLELIEKMGINQDFKFDIDSDDEILLPEVEKSVKPSVKNGVKPNKPMDKKPMDKKITTDDIIKMIDDAMPSKRNSIRPNLGKGEAKTSADDVQKGGQKDAQKGAQAKGAIGANGAISEPGVPGATGITGASRGNRG